MGVPIASSHIQIKIRIPNPSMEPPVYSKAPIQIVKDIDDLCTFKIKIESKNLDHGCIKDQWPYANQDQDPKPQLATSFLQSLSPDFNDMDVLCTFKMKIKSQIWIMVPSKTIDHIPIKIKISNRSQEPPASSKAQSQEFRDMEVHVTFKIQIEKQNSEHGYRKDQCQYPNQDQDAKTQLRMSSVL